MKCPKCNAEIDNDAKFCPECGSKIEKVVFCANCGTKLEEGATFCSNCGEKIEQMSTDVQEKKRCPYCGEEILSTAQKCKHCGEWLEDTEDENDDDSLIDTSDTDDDLTLLKQNVPLSNTILQIAFWGAILGVCIYTLHDLIPKGKLGILGFIASIPEWIGYIFDAIGLTILLISLKTSMSKLKNNFSIFFILLIVASCINSIISCITDQPYIISFFCECAPYVIALILGTKICGSYKGEINKLGKIMTAYGIIELSIVAIILFALLLMGTIGIDEDELYWLYFVIMPAEAGITYFFYKKLMDIQLRPEK